MGFSGNHLARIVWFFAVLAISANAAKLSPLARAIDAVVGTGLPGVSDLDLTELSEERLRSLGYRPHDVLAAIRELNLKYPKKYLELLEVGAANRNARLNQLIVLAQKGLGQTLVDTQLPHKILKSLEALQQEIRLRQQDLTRSEIELRKQAQMEELRRAAGVARDFVRNEEQEFEVQERRAALEKRHEVRIQIALEDHQEPKRIAEVNELSFQAWRSKAIQDLEEGFNHNGSELLGLIANRDRPFKVITPSGEIPFTLDVAMRVAVSTDMDQKPGNRMTLDGSPLVFRTQDAELLRRLGVDWSGQQIPVYALDPRWGEDELAATARRLGLLQQTLLWLRQSIVLAESLDKLPQLKTAMQSQVAWNGSLSKGATDWGMVNEFEHQREFGVLFSDLLWSNRPRGFFSRYYFGNKSAPPYTGWSRQPRRASWNPFAPNLEQILGIRRLRRGLLTREVPMMIAIYLAGTAAYEAHTLGYLDPAYAAAGEAADALIRAMGTSDSTHEIGFHSGVGINSTAGTDTTPKFKYLQGNTREIEVASQLELDKGKFTPIPQVVRGGETLQVISLLPTPPRNGLVPIGIPVNSRVVSVHVDGKAVEVLLTPRGLPVVRSSVPIKYEVLSDGKPEVNQDIRAVDPLIVRDWADRMREIGLQTLPFALSQLADRAGGEMRNLNAEEVMSVIKENSLYTYKYPRIYNPLPRTHPLYELGLFVDSNGEFCIQCNGAESLLRKILQDSLVSRADVEVGPRILYPMANGSEIVGEGHTDTYVRTHGDDQESTYDATPHKKDSKAPDPSRNSWTRNFGGFFRFLGASASWRRSEKAPQPLNPPPTQAEVDSSTTPEKSKSETPGAANPTVAGKKDPAIERHSISLVPPELHQPTSQIEHRLAQSALNDRPTLGSKAPEDQRQSVGPEPERRTWSVDIQEIDPDPKVLQLLRNTIRNHGGRYIALHNRNQDPKLITHRVMKVLHALEGYYKGTMPLAELSKQLKSFGTDAESVRKLSVVYPSDIPGALQQAHTLAMQQYEGLRAQFSESRLASMFPGLSTKVEHQLAISPLKELAKHSSWNRRYRTRNVEIPRPLPPGEIAGCPSMETLAGVR